MAEVVFLRAVSKKFNLYASRVAQAAAAFNIGWIFPSRSFRPIGSKLALADVSISIKKGEKVGVIGRNGSGKTTLLRVVLGDLNVSVGEVSASDNIQAMMQTGFGFSDDLTGRQNIENSLYYNGLPRKARDQAIEDVVQFVELGEFLDHPLSTYSLGMRARLEFATATAIRPDILVIDEVMGAGDGYFANKCAERMKHLTSNTTLLLVSHSMTQIIEYCERVIWMDRGQVRMDGPAASVIKSYENFMEQQQSEAEERTIPGESKEQVEGKLKLHNGLQSAVSEAGLILAKQEDHEFIVNIEELKFKGRLAKTKSAEVGDALEIDARITSSGSQRKDLTPLLLGMDEQGKLLFTGKIPRSFDVGSGALNISSRVGSLGLGIGKYFIVLVLLEAETSNILCVSEDILHYVVTETNHSDPPRLHLTGNWVTDGLDAVQAARISAWV